MSVNQPFAFSAYRWALLHLETAYIRGQGTRGLFMTYVVYITLTGDMIRAKSWEWIYAR